MGLGSYAPTAEGLATNRINSAKKDGPNRPDSGAPKSATAIRQRLVAGRLLSRRRVVAGLLDLFFSCRGGRATRRGDGRFRLR